MNKIVIVLILAVIGANSMTLMEKYPINFTPKRSIMTLLTQVDAQLKSGGPLDAIQNLLSEFVATVTEEQANHDALWAEQQEECDSEIAFRHQEIDNATAALQEGQETLDGCTSQKVRAAGDLKITKKQLIENRNFLAQVEDTRRRQAYDFETFTTAYAFASRAVDEALVILEEIWSGESSFMQLSRHMNGMLKSTMKVKKAHQMTGLMAAMVQLANKDIQADDEALNRVKTLLENFRQKLETGLEEASAAEAASIEAYNDERARLVSTIESLQAQQQGLEAEIHELDKCIVNQSSIVSSASLKVSRNSRLLQDAENLCEAVAEEYKVATEARSEELELLHAISERVEARFGELSEGVVERGKQDEFQYEANYDYEQKDFVPSNAQ